MNASSWRKTADLVAQGTQANQQVQAAATAEFNQLESLPLSALSADDSGPPQVTYVMILHYNTTLTPSSKAIYSGTKYYDTHIEFHSLFLDVSSTDV